MRGILVRQSGGTVLVRVGLDDAAGLALGTGTATLRVMEYQPDNTLKQLDFGTGFALRAPGATFLTPTAAMVHQAAPDGVLTTTGLWTFLLTNPMLANFTVGNGYVVEVTHSAVAGVVYRSEFQYGGADGDLVIDSLGRVTLSVGNGFAATVLNTPSPPSTTVFTVSVANANCILPGMQVIGGPTSSLPNARLTVGSVQVLTSTTATITVSTSTPMTVGFAMTDVLTIG